MNDVYFYSASFREYIVIFSLNMTRVLSDTVEALLSYSARIFCTVVGVEGVWSSSDQQSQTPIFKVVAVCLLEPHKLTGNEIPTYMKRFLLRRTYLNFSSVHFHSQLIRCLPHPNEADKFETLATVISCKVA